MGRMADQNFVIASDADGEGSRGFLSDSRPEGVAAVMLYLTH